MASWQWAGHLPDLYQANDLACATGSFLPSPSTHAASLGNWPGYRTPARGDCRRDHAAAQAAVLGPQEAARGIATARSQAALAGALDDGRFAAASGAERAAPPAPASGAAEPTVSAGARAQRPVVHRLQEPAPGPNRGLVPHR